MWSMHEIFDWVSSHRRCRRCLFVLSLCRMHCHCLNISLEVDQIPVHRSYSCYPFVRHFWFCSNRKSSLSALSVSAAMVHGAFDSFANCCPSLSLLNAKWIKSWNICSITLCARTNSPDGNLTGTPIFNWLIRSNAMRCRFFRSTSFSSCKWVFFRCKYLPVADFQMQLPCRIEKRVMDELIC